MKKSLILLLLVLLLGGCKFTGECSDGANDSASCAQDRARQGYEFDPNCMSCSQMWSTVQAVRRAAYWSEKGYVVDPNSLTWQQVAEKVADIVRARYWKERGYDLDPNNMTALEMDRCVEELKETQYRTDSGYYYDRATQTAYVDEDKTIALRSLPTPTPTNYWPCFSNSSRSSCASRTGGISDRKKGKGPKTARHPRYSGPRRSVRKSIPPRMRQ